VAATGCGGDDETTVGASGPPTDAASLSWAVPERPLTLDPLYARTPTEQLAARQVHEPLVDEVTGPFDLTRRTPGLALSVRPSADATVWRARLRPGVRFQDGQPFNAAAVLANVDRWLAAPAGREALGGLLVDAPRPDLVRFILPSPDAEFPLRLASPRLGIVSPAAIDAATGEPIDPEREPASGTGPFELRERDGDGVLLARNTGWWGAERGLGPGVDQLELRVVADPDERLKLLGEGVVRVADLSPEQLAEVRDDPLLTVVRQGDGRVVGLERSVRGVPAGEPVPSLNAVWIAGIGAD
jgi:ABC-type transport system substrate-binding protein